MPLTVGVVDVVWCPNPLRPVADRQVKRVVLTGTDTIASIVSRLGLQGTSLIARLNAWEVPRRRWGRKRVHQGDALVLLQRARGVDPYTATAKFIMEYGMTYEAAVVAAYALAFVSSAAISLALTAVANALLKRDAPRERDQAAAASAYSIEGGANQARPYGPLQLVLGEHRVFPDYASRPFSEFVPDPTSTHRVLNATPETEVQTPPAWSYTETYDAGTDIYTVTPASPWTEISPDSNGHVFYFGDNQARTYDTLNGSVTEPHTFVIIHQGGTSLADQVTTYEKFDQYTRKGVSVAGMWQPIGTSMAVIVAYGYLVTDWTERLTSIFNFGLGDIAQSDYRVGSTPLDSFKAWQLDESTVPAGAADRTSLVGYTSTDYAGTDYPDDVAIMEGGKLEQHDGVANEGWVERSGRAGRYVQIDIAGRLFRQGSGDLGVLDCVIEAEYREAGSSTWTPMSFSPATMSNGSATVYRRTFTQAFAVDVDSIRVRRTTPEPTQARDVSDFELTRVKIFKPQAALYPAQRRVGLMIQATGQLNGRIDRLSALVKAKHWTWFGVTPWTPGVYPESGGGSWLWTETTNPAWLFLFYARGGFLNDAEPRGWRDYPHPSNGPRLFGAGLTNDRIDYAAIVAWGQWCDSQGLQCRMVIDEQRNCGDVLDQIAGSGRGAKSWASGKLSVVWEGAGQPVVAAFSIANICAGTFNVAYDTDTTVHEIALQYARSDADYQPDTVYATVPGVAQVVNQRSEQAVYSMPQAQAQRLANLLAASRYYHRRRITWESTLEALTVQRGDVVQLAHDLTQWAFSGRLLRLVVAGGQVTQVQLTCKVDNAAGDAAFFLYVRQPGGTYMSIACTPPAAPTDVVDVIDAWAAADAPGQLGGDADPQNAASNWPDTVPEDWMFLAGPTATPGKRARITAMEPSSGRRVRITARDEYEEYYPLEYGLGGASEPASGERLVARGFNLAIDPADAGGWRLSWELQNAHGAEVTVSVNGGAATQVPTHGVLSVLGTEVLLPAYAAGTTLAIALLPIAAGTPVAVEGDSLTVTV